ncbi:MAG: hypothetical protein K2P81_05355 [Bacteriovoracaceae bacterium]|nr:hypothetical protein [Bacteriovoracaceae bacterium]
MKTNIKKEFARWGVIVAMVGILIGFTQCIGTQSTSDDYSSTHSEILLPEEPVDEEAPEIGVKDADRLFETMSVLTGVPSNNGTIRGIFNSDYKAQLPVGSRVEAMLETHMLGATKLATEFCNVLINDGTLRAAIWPANIFNFGANSNTVFAPGSASRDQFIVLMLERFWGKNVLEISEYEKGYDAIDKLITDVLNGQTGSAAMTVNTAKSACTAALSSSQVIFQ